MVSSDNGAIMQYRKKQTSLDVGLSERISFSIGSYASSGPISLSAIRDVIKTMDIKSPNHNTDSFIQLRLEENLAEKKVQT